MKNLTLSEALSEIRVSRSAFYRMRALGKAPKILKLPNGQIRVRRQDLDAWLASCEEAETQQC